MNQVLLVGGVCIGSLTPGQAKHAAALRKLRLWHNKKKTSGKQRFIHLIHLAFLEYSSCHTTGGAFASAACERCALICALVL